MHNIHDENKASNIAAIIQSDAVTPATRKVLEERLAHQKVTAPLFFDARSFKILDAVCERLIPQIIDSNKVDLPGLLDKKLFEKKGKGWRYDLLPPEEETFRLGIRLIDELSERQYYSDFCALDEKKKDEILQMIAEDKNGVYGKINGALFFTELLAAITEIYYSHPFAKESIGDLSFADAHGRQL